MVKKKTCIEGTIPSALCNATGLYEFDILRASRLTGTIPDCPNTSVFDSLGYVEISYSTFDL